MMGNVGMLGAEHQVATISQSVQAKRPLTSVFMMDPTHPHDFPGLGDVWGYIPFSVEKAPNWHGYAKMRNRY